MSLPVYNRLKIKAKARSRILMDAIQASGGMSPATGFTDFGEGLLAYSLTSEGLPLYFALQSPEDLLPAPLDSLSPGAATGTSTLVGNITFVQHVQSAVHGLSTTVGTLTAFVNAVATSAGTSAVVGTMRLKVGLFAHPAGVAVVRAAFASPAHASEYQVGATVRFQVDLTGSFV